MSLISLMTLDHLLLLRLVELSTGDLSSKPWFGSSRLSIFFVITSYLQSPHMWLKFQFHWNPEERIWELASLMLFNHHHGIILKVAVRVHYNILKHPYEEPIFLVTSSTLAIQGMPFSLIVACLPPAPQRCDIASPLLEVHFSMLCFWTISPLPPRSWR